MRQQTAIGIDVGGTKIAAAVVDPGTGEVLVESSVPTNRAEGAQSALAAVVRSVEAMLIEADARGLAPSAIGIGVPELVDTAGRIRSAWNFDWRAVDFEAEIGGGLPVVIESDARCGALCEHRLGAGRGVESFSFVTIGTGISAVQCIGGRIHAGANGFAIHFGSSDLVASDPRTHEMSPFNLEAFASGAGIAATFHARFGGRLLDTRSLVEGAGGEQGTALVTDAATAMASYLGQMVNMLDPDAIVVGGGLGLSDFYFDALARLVPNYVWAEQCRDIPIMRSHFGARAAMVGAALCAVEHSPAQRPVRNGVRQSSTVAS